MSSKKAKYYAEDTGAPARRRKRRRRRERRIPSWVYRIALVLLVAVLGLVIYVNRDALTPERISAWVQERVVGAGEGDGYPVSIEGSEVLAGNFRSTDGDLVMVSDTHLTVLNSTAGEVLSRQHSLSFPVLRLGGDRALIYNLGGKGYQVERRSETVLRGDMEQNILGGAVAGNGAYALLTESADYFGELTVFTHDSKEQFRYRFSSCYPVAAALNADATRALVCGVYAQGGAFASSLYLIDLNSDAGGAPAATFPETTLLDALWYNDGSAAAIGDDTAALVSPEGTITKYSYDGWQLCAYAGENGVTAIALSSYAGSDSGKLVLLDSSGRAVLAAQLPAAPDSVSVYGNTATVLAGGTVTAYSIADGTAFASADAGADAVALTLANESAAYILGVSEVRTVSLNG